MERKEERDHITSRLEKRDALCRKERRVCHQNALVFFFIQTESAYQSVNWKNYSDNKGDEHHSSDVHSCEHLSWNQRMLATMSLIMLSGLSEEFTLIFFLIKETIVLFYCLFVCGNDFANLWDTRHVGFLKNNCLQKFHNYSTLHSQSEHRLFCSTLCKLLPSTAQGAWQPSKSVQSLESRTWWT